MSAGGPRGALWSGQPGTRSRQSWRTRGTVGEGYRVAATGHDLPLAASLEFSCSGIAGWPVCGDQLAPRFGSTRPEADSDVIENLTVRTTAVLPKPDGTAPAASRGAPERRSTNANGGTSQEWLASLSGNTLV